ncbi:exonuclease domain-containing protein [Edwardsiella piscicida]|nr:exonuclease domain-containing protein [Edwardsiella piscicida]
MFSVPGTCVVGYNNIRFDDEVSRNLFYRNFFDPYAYSWQNGNSRWDLLDVVRTCYALRHEDRLARKRTGATQLQAGAPVPGQRH